MSTPTPDPSPLPAARAPLAGPTSPHGGEARVTNDALQAEVNLLVRQGYRVVSQSEFAAYLVKAKKFSIIWAIIWFVIAVFPLVIYLIYYMFKWDHRVYLTVDPATGKVERLIGTRKSPYPGPPFTGW